MSTTEQNNLIIIAGPTASGKSSVAVELAQKIHGSVISADSMQVYRGMDIGTAKITKAQMQGIPHYLIDILDPSDEWNVVLFQQAARRAIREITAAGRVPILCGGTGFYIQALLYNIDFTEHRAAPAESNLVSPDFIRLNQIPPDFNWSGQVQPASIRQHWYQLAQEKGPLYVHEQLALVDPASAAAIPAGNVRRMVRALEYYELTGKTISAHNEEQHQQQAAFHALYFVLTMERGELYERIDQRVDQMMADGLLQEVQNLRTQGLTLQNQSMQGLGYRQIMEYLDGKYSLEEAVEQIKLQTRHFAKRQETWFRREKRRDPDLIIVDVDSFRNSEAAVAWMYSKWQELYC